MQSPSVKNGKENWDVAVMSDALSNIQVPSTWEDSNLYWFRTPEFAGGFMVRWTELPFGRSNSPVALQP